MKRLKQVPRFKNLLKPISGFALGVKCSHASMLKRSCHVKSEAFYMVPVPDWSNFACHFPYT